jgi:ubiquinone/menaquinone biosynthesis C-methylase UbiE
MSENAPYLRPPEVAAAFQNRDAVASYRHRPRYPPETFEILAGLIVDRPRAVLDLGCGTGNVTRPLAPRVDRIDAVDISPAMIEESKRLPGGDHPAIRWIVGRAEEVELHPPYALATAGDSLHWMDWTVVLPRLAGALSPNGMFAILDVNGEIVGETEVLRRGRRKLTERYATYRRPSTKLLDELERRGLFREDGRRETAPVTVRQSAAEYVESFHAHAPLAWGRIDPDDAASFDSALLTLVHDEIG